MTDVLAFDAATFTGWARGRVDGIPECGSLRFGKPGCSENVVFGQAMQWFADMLRPQPRPDVVVIEALLPANAKVGMTTSSVRDRLAGLHAICRGTCELHGIKEVQSANVNDVRGHFIGTRMLHRDSAKAATLDRCRRLGWSAQNTDEADALALWHFACSLINPELTLQVSPLFNKQLRHG